MNRTWLSRMNARHARGDLVRPAADPAPSPADPLPANLGPMPLPDRMLFLFAAACLLAAAAGSAALALGWLP